MSEGRGPQATVCTTPEHRSVFDCAALFEVVVGRAAALVTVVGVLRRSAFGCATPPPPLFPRWIQGSPQGSLLSHGSGGPGKFASLARVSEDRLPSLLMT